MVKFNKHKEKLLIIDGNALIHRSFHALPPTLRTKEGVLVNAVYGFTAFLFKAIKEFKPAYVALTLDRKAKTFRHEKFEAYKATRVKAPDELYEQIPLVKEMATALNIPIYELDGYEADDLIGTIAERVGDEVETIIMTGDQDTMQLVNETTFVYTMSRGLSESVIYDTAGVKAKYGFLPILMIDYKGLRGDPSDNIPGVKGIGEKTATELLTDFGSLEGVYENINSEKIKPRIRQLLIDNQEAAVLSKQLATIELKAPIKFDLVDAKFGNFNQTAVTEKLSEFEFKSLMPKLKEIVKDYASGEANNLKEKIERNEGQFVYQLINDDEAFKKFLVKLKKQTSFTFDTETTGLDNFTEKILGVSFAWTAGEAYYLNLDNGSVSRPTDVNLFNFLEEPKTDMHVWLKELKPIFENEAIKKNGHNLKFDIKVLGGLGIEVKGVEFDTMIASYLLHPDNRQHNLDALTFTELGFSKISKTELTGEKNKKKDFASVPPEKLANYSCEDADFTNRLVIKLDQELRTQNLKSLFDNLEMPLVAVLARMENAGVVLDVKYLAELDKEMNATIDKLQKKIWRLAGEEFNINSVQQMRKILFEKLAIETTGLGKTKTGISTGADELVKLKDRHEIIEAILEYREVAKISSTYVKNLPELVNKKTGRLHTNYNQTVAATGRLSSSNPNLQNIPMRTDFGRQIRRAFVAPQGKVLLSLDYSQIELRLAAHMSADEGLVQAFKNNLDIHTATAAAINKVELSEVTKEMRRAAKAINFGILYGQGAHGLSGATGISYSDAKKFIAEYFAQFVGVKNYIDSCVEQTRENGYVETLLGRRRYLPDINSSIAMVRKAAERMAVNAPLQGTAADMIKKAMIEVDTLIERKLKNKVQMILQVHDELVFEVDKKYVKEVEGLIRVIMENVIKLAVPILVEAKVGENWEEMEKI